MERPQRFVYRILALHGTLLAVVLAVVSIASAEIYKSTRDDAIAAAKIRQELLAYQTCRGIETFYSSIISSLGWIQDRQEMTTTPNDRRNPTVELEGGPHPLAAQMIAEQLGDRVSALFVFNQSFRSAVPRNGGARYLAARGGIGQSVVGILPADAKLAVGELPQEMRDWLQNVKAVNISRFIKFQGEGVSLVAAPFNDSPEPVLPRRTATTPTMTGPTATPVMRTPRPRVLVAVVPGSEIESNFLPLLTDENSSATLVDGQMDVITSSNRKLEGSNLAETNSADVRDMVMTYHDHPRTTTRLFSSPISLHGIDLGPRMVTLAPVHIGQDEWALFFAYPVGDIDAAVNTLFRRAVVWAGFVAAMITGVLVSTAVQMIHWRVRLERIRHQVLTRELKQARRIQEQWLPDKSTIPNGLDVAALNTPASHISGDFYNWFELSDGRQVFVIGDVTGHGMAAAFLMATTQLLVRNTMARLTDPGAAMEAVNRQLSSQMFHGQFVTMLILALDLKNNQIDAASAGHPPPLIGSGGKFKRLELEAQLVLGVERNVRYPTQRFSLAPASSLLLYTDGVLDARSAGGDHFGTERLLDSLDGRTGGAQEMIDAVSESVRVFCGSFLPDDDLTLLAIQLRKNSVTSVKPLAAKNPESQELPTATR